MHIEVFGQKPIVIFDFLHIAKPDLCVPLFLCFVGVTDLYLLCKFLYPLTTNDFHSNGHELSSSHTHSEFVVSGLSAPPRPAAGGTSRVTFAQTLPEHSNLTFTRTFTTLLTMNHNSGTLFGFDGKSAGAVNTLTVITHILTTKINPCEREYNPQPSCWGNILAFYIPRNMRNMQNSISKI